VGIVGVADRCHASSGSDHANVRDLASRAVATVCGDAVHQRRAEPVRSCTIIVTSANALTREIHDRMPVLLQPHQIDAWVNGTAGAELLKPAADDALRIWPVSRRVNKTRNGDDDPGLIEEIEFHA
jgi:putative SOS response-associated peptidase YedK